MCANADKEVHLRTLIAEIKVLFAQWRKTRKFRTPAEDLPVHNSQRAS